MRRLSPSAARFVAALLCSVSCAAALAACTKKAPPPDPMLAILASAPNQRARALRDEIAALFKAGQFDAAAEKIALAPKVVHELLRAMDELHHKKTSVPAFEVVRYVEAMRDLGENLRGFERVYNKGNPPALKQDMVRGMVDLLRNKVR